MRRWAMLLLLAGPLVIRIPQITAANNAVIWLNGRRFACHDAAGCKRVTPGGTLIVFLPKGA